MLLEQITVLIGDIPYGFEPLVYVLAVLVLLLRIVFMVLSVFFAIIFCGGDVHVWFC